MIVDALLTKTSCGFTSPKVPTPAATFIPPAVISIPPLITSTPLVAVTIPRDSISTTSLLKVDPAIEILPSK